MDRKFSEVFGELGLRKDIAEFFSDVTVSKVSKVTARRLLRVTVIGRCRSVRIIISLLNTVPNTWLITIIRRYLWR